MQLLKKHLDIKHIKACILLLKFGTHFGRLFYLGLTLSVHVSSFRDKNLYLITAECRNVVPIVLIIVSSFDIFRVQNYSQQIKYISHSIFYEVLERFENCH